jgi:hypothetical protein
MDAAIHPLRPGRGAGLLLAHCEALGNENVERTPPFTRLEAVVGGELARLLVFALSGVHGRRGSSSP